MALRGGIITSKPLCFSQDGKLFFAPCGNDARVYSAKSGDHIATLSGHDDVVTAVTLDPSSSRHLYTCSLDGSVKLWDILEGTCSRTYTIGEPIQHMVISRQLNMLYLSTDHRQGDAGRVRALQMPLGQLLPGRAKLRSSGCRLAMSHSGRCLAVLDRNSLLVWAAGSDLSTKPLNFHHTKPYTCVSINPNDTVLAAGDASGRIQLWPNFSQALLQLGAGGGVPPALPPPTTVHWHAHPVGCLEFSLDGAYLLSGGMECVLVLWQLPSLTRTYLPRLGGPLVSLSACAADAARYLLAQADNTVRVVNTATMAVEASVHGLRPRPRGAAAAAAAALQPGSGHLVVSCDGAMLQVFDTVRDAHVGRLQVGHRSQLPVPANGAAGQHGVYGPPSEPLVTALAFSGDGGGMATVDVRPDAGPSGSTECCLRFWDRSGGGGSGGGVTAGAPAYSMNTRVDEPHRGGVTGLAYHPRTDLVATCGEDGELKLWRRGGGGGGGGDKAAAGRWRCASAGGYKRRVLRAAAFSADGSLLAVGAGPAATLWDPSSAGLVAALPPPLPPKGSAPAAGDVTALAFVTGSPHLVGLLGGPVPRLVVWDLLTACVAWSLPLPAAALAADPCHPGFAVSIPAAPLAPPPAAAGAVPPGAKAAAAAAPPAQLPPPPPGFVLLFSPASPWPRFVCPLPAGASATSILFVPPGTPLAAAAAGASPDGVSPLLLLTDGRRFALAATPAAAAAAAARDADGAAPGDGSATAAAVAAEAKRQQGRRLDEALGPTQLPSAGGGAEPEEEAAAAATAARKALAALFGAPSHVLPPPSALCPTLLELLISGPVAR